MFWQKYLELCNSVGKAPNVVAAEVGVKSSGTVTGWKNGALPRSTILTKLAGYFDIDVSELIGDTDEKEPPAQGGEPIGPAKQALLEMIGGMTDNEIAALTELVKATIKMRDTKEET